MVPGTDYPQLAELLPWVLKNLGMTDYEGALEAAIDATRIRTGEMPDTFDDDRALLTVTLPDTEQFTDGNWALGIFSVNVDGMLQRAIDIIDGAPGYETALDELAVALDPVAAAAGEDVMTIIDNLFNRAFVEEAAGEDDGAADGALPADASAIVDVPLFKWFSQYFGDMVFSGLGAAGQDGRTVRMVCRPGMTIPVLLRLEFKPNSMQVNTSGLAVYFGRWIDLGGVVGEMFEKINSGEVLLEDAGEESGEDSSEKMPDELSGLLDMLTAYTDGLETEAAEAPEALEPLTLDELREMLVDIKDKLNSLAWLQRMFLYEIKPGEVCTLRADGLDEVTVLDEAHSPNLAEIMADFNTEAETQAVSEADQ